MIEATNSTGILNDALAELGSTERVTAISDSQSNSARRARTLWGGILRELLALHPWNFAIRHAMLNAGGAPEGGTWRTRFQLPADCIRWLPPGQDQRGWYRGERAGDAILADHDGPLPCRYIALIEDTTRWPPSFTSAFMFRLAASLAEPVTQSEGIKDRLLERARDALKAAKRIDGLETGIGYRPSVVARSDWLSARNGYGGYRGR